MNNNSQKLLIFDVDGTLLLNGTAAKYCFFNAFRDAFGIEPSGKGVVFAGQTDRGVLRQILNKHDVKGDFEQQFDKFSFMFTNCMRKTYPHANGPHLLPGVTKLLDRLYKRDDVILALGTGNLRETSMIKLGRFDLTKYFEIGGFGSDFEMRKDVVNQAISEAKEVKFWDGNLSNAWVIGDTLDDVRAAKENGIRSFIVKTGITPKSELEDCGADVVIDDFSDIKLVFKNLGLI